MGGGAEAAGTLDDDEAIGGDTVDLEVPEVDCLDAGALSQFLNGFWRNASDSLGWSDGANTSS